MSTVQLPASGRASRPAPAPGRTSQQGWRSRRDWARRAPLLPALVYLVVVTQLPFVATLVISLMRWNALYPDDKGFSGLHNYVNAFQDATLRSSIITTIVLTVSVVLVSLLIGLGLALLLDRAFFGRGFVRTILIAPFLVVPVAAALLWKHALYNPEYGLLNGGLHWLWSLFGSDSPPQPDWIGGTPKLAVEAALVWQWTPFMMLILLAGLQSRPLDVYEAARVDGAGAWQVFRFITLPHLRRYLELAALLGCIYVVQNFDAVFTLTSGGLGTANLPYTIYETFYQAHDYGQASANGVIVVFGSIVIATFALRQISSLLREES
ncbi:sorbitol/mannitol transport system permease protein [Motilibacter rhizosphaerae]|uniref:Sorbitol/mannitol transport system permease protein n=1 Tax=Motilibacter rhizosphaerae TaxID=598652 RepID=A0A4Q7NGH1_9ACTN|nr:sugar ABC transporter permease [Motilibacter rhizosphaerae]RZS82828.1 sorbitol/mannitol transport system permease protein [Motilibacter rhizosphaerae]